MIDALSLERFNDLVASYGADPERWPVPLRGSATGCLVASEAARAAWREAADLDADLDSVPDLKMSPELVATVLAVAGAPEEENSAMLPGPLRFVLPYAAAAAIALVIGLSVPSPLRDTANTGLEIQAAISGPAVIVGDTDNGTYLTRLALVDVSSFADDETNTSTASDTENTLSDLPLL
ncbi:MAG: hypothetical protein ACI8S3_001471 [Alphaproteobacteria bacterium]|jgi:hypothetical protein